MGASRCRFLICLLAPALVLASAAHAWQASPDVSIDLAGSAIFPSDVIDDGDAATPMPIDLGPLPSSAEIAAYTVNPEGVKFFVLEHTLTLPGGVVAGPRDVMTWDGSVYALELAFGPLGVPDGAAIDALGVINGDSGVGVSFDTSIVFQSVALDDADVMDIADFSLVFDSIGEGLPASADVDAVSEASDGNGLILSFDVAGEIAGIAYDDEDLLRFVSGPNPSWSLEVDASAADPNWQAADVNAVHFVPEPGAIAQILAGTITLWALARRRHFDERTR